MHYENNVGQDVVASVQEDLGCDIRKYMEDKDSENLCTVSRACEKIEEDKNLLPHFLVVARDESFVLPIIRKIIKKIQGQEPENTKRIAKINAVNLNSIQIEDQVEELKGACVMIEEASLLEKKTCERLIQIIKREDNTILFAFISGDGEINEHLKDHLHYYIQC